MGKKFDVMCELLSICRTPKKKKQLAEKITVKNELLTQYLNFLVSKRLLFFSSDLYKITERGKKFTEEYSRIRNIVN